MTMIEDYRNEAAAKRAPVEKLQAFYCGFILGALVSFAICMGVLISVVQ